MEINRNSLLYKYASITTREWEMDDSCSFMYALLRSTAAILAVLTVTVILLIPIGDLIAWIAHLVTWGWVEPTATAALAVVFFVIVSIIGALTKLRLFVEESNTIKQLRESYKDKVCSKVEFK